MTITLEMRGNGRTRECCLGGSYGFLPDDSAQVWRALMPVLALSVCCGDVQVWSVEYCQLCAAFVAAAYPTSARTIC